MATLYVKAAGGNWSAAGTWSATGAGGVDSAGPPTAADNCIAELASGNLTIDGTSGSPSLCRSFDTTSGTGSWAGTLTAGSTAQLDIGDATAGAGNVSLKLNSGITFAPNAASVIRFISTSATLQTIDCGGKTMGNITFASASGGNQAFTTNTTTATTSDITWTKSSIHMDGATDNSGLSHSFGRFLNSVASAGTLTMGTASVTITRGSVGDVFTYNGSNTLSALSSTITFTGSSAQMGVSGGSWGTVIFQGAGTSWISNTANLTFVNLTFTGTASKTCVAMLNGNATVTGTFTANGNSATNRLLLRATNLADVRTVTAATVSCSNLDVQDITGAGAGSWDLSAITGNSGDCGGNTGITFTTAADQTWSGTSGGNWSANAWTTRVPLPQDNATISSAFSASQTVTSDMPRLGKSINWTGATGTPTWSFGSTGNTIFGSMTLASGMTVSGTNSVSFAGRSTYTITTAGVSWTTPIIFVAPSGTYTLQDAITITPAQNVTVTNGGLNTNNFDITCGFFLSNNSNTRSITLGTSTITMNGTTATTSPNFTTTTGLTFSGASANFVYGTASANTRTFAGGGLTFGTVTYTLSGSTGELDITGSNTFATINFSDASNARSLKFTAGTTTTITSAFNVQGTSGKLMTVDSITAATHTLSRASGVVGCDYLSVTNSLAGGGAAWYAGANSTDGGGNTGWIFTGVAGVGGASLMRGIG